MKIFLTGSSGMVGKNILEGGTCLNNEWFCPSHSELDLLNYAHVEAALHNFQPDLIIHAAGVVGGIQANIKEPVRFFYDNLEIGKNVVWAAKKLGIKKILNLSSSCMYPKDKDTMLVEEDILTGSIELTNEGYALAKIVVAKLCAFISNEFKDLHYKTLIPCNLYGRWDKFDLSHGHMIPAVIKKIHEAVKNNSNTVEIWGDGTARREFMYAADLADFILFAADNFEKLPNMINVGLGHDFSILEYYKQIAKVVGFKGDFSFNLTKPIGMKRKLIDVSKSNRLGWTAKTSLKDGLEKTYNFFLSENASN